MCLSNVFEDLYKINPDDATLETITNLKFEYNAIVSQRVGSMLAKTQQKYFELGDKPHRLLARQLRQSQASRAIHKIRDDQGITITDPSKINITFAAFYENLYQSKVKTIDAQKINSFLESSTLPMLDDTAAKALDAEITLEEL